ncbi:MAG TPA: hypothetical protein VIL70_05735 [Chthoniobacterales bacterium]
MNRTSLSWHGTGTGDWFDNKIFSAKSLGVRAGFLWRRFDHFGVYMILPHLLFLSPRYCALPPFGAVTLDIEEFFQAIPKLFSGSHLMYNVLRGELHSPGGVINQALEFNWVDIGQLEFNLDLKSLSSSLGASSST